MDWETVQAEYVRLGYDRGWVFAMTPLANLASCKAVFVGLNPGGDGEDDAWEFAEGNAYFDGRWVRNSDALYPIQKQVIALHALLGLGKDDVFAGQFIPFRSPNINALAHKTEAFGFGLRLWRWVIDQTRASLFLCLGSAAAYNIALLLDAKLEGRRESGFGGRWVSRYVSQSGRVVVQLPHLSRFHLFSLKDPGKLAQAHASILWASRPVT